MRIVKPDLLFRDPFLDAGSFVRLKKIFNQESIVDVQASPTLLSSQQSMASGEPPPLGGDTYPR